jgi:plastocyanin
VRGILTAATLLLMSVFVPACSSGGAPACDTPTAATTVEIQDNAFTPACVAATGGTTLTIENHDGVPHTFTVKDTDVNVQLDGNATQQASLADVAAGTYEVLCSYHPEMRQTLQVS